MAIDRKTDRLIKRTTMVATATAAYFLLTADYGPEENPLTPIRRLIESAESSVKRFIFGKETEATENNKVQNHQALSQVQDDHQEHEKKAKASTGK